MKPLALVPIVFLALFTAVRSEAQEGEPPPREVALAANRLELRPYGGWAVVHDSVTGGFVGADVTFRLSPLVALGGDVA